jgi:hypothetical protein
MPQGTQAQKGLSLKCVSHVLVRRKGYNLSFQGAARGGGLYSEHKRESHKREDHCPALMQAASLLYLHQGFRIVPWPYLDKRPDNESCKDKQSPLVPLGEQPTKELAE